MNNEMENKLVVKNYRDQFLRFHEKKDKDSNNAWLYSAVYSKLLSYYNEDDAEEYEYSLWEEANDCVINLKRHPYDSKPDCPPLSAEEVLGLSIFDGLGMVKKLKENNWCMMQYNRPRFNLFKFVRDLALLIIHHKDRNYWWEHKLEQIYFLTTMVPFQYRAFLLRQAWEDSNLFYDLCELLAKIFKNKDRSSRQINWLVWGFDIEGVQDYYEDQEHPSVKIVEIIDRNMI